jgi:2-dehydropantoate 2-reductase
MLNILIMGAGAIGCFVGGSLAARGHQVTLVGRQPLMDKINRDGLVIQWPDQPPQTVFPQTAVTVSTPDQPYDFIFITVKSYATTDAARQLTSLNLKTGQTWLVSLQNGIGNEEILAEIFNPQQVIAGTITIPISVPEPGVITVNKAKGGLGLAPLTTGQPAEKLAEALNQAGLTTPTYADYLAMKWSKLLLNIVNNASSAILNQPPAEIIANPALFNLEIMALREAVAVMKAQKITAVKLPGYPVDWLARLVSMRWLPLPLQRAILRPSMQSGRGTKMPSLQIDLASGRQSSEIQALNGAIVQAGQQTGIPTPINQALTETLDGLIQSKLNWSHYQHQPEKLLATIKQNF